MSEDIKGEDTFDYDGFASAIKERWRDMRIISGGDRYFECTLHQTFFAIDSDDLCAQCLLDFKGEKS